MRWCQNGDFLRPVFLASLRGAPNSPTDLSR